MTSICFDRIPVYVLNALYLAPITLWTYLKHGRSAKVRTDYDQIDNVVEEHRYHDHEDHGTDVQSSQHEGYTSEHNEEHQDMSRHGPMQEDAGDHHVSDTLICSTMLANDPYLQRLPLLSATAALAVCLATLSENGSCTGLVLKLTEAKCG